MSARQTIYVRPGATAYEAVCEQCLHEGRPARLGRLGTVRGSLRAEADVAFVSCARGHRLRVRRVARTFETTGRL